MKKYILEAETHLMLDKDKIRHATVKFVKELNLHGGSNGSINLYNLTSAYLLKPECREEINAIVSKHLSF